jgi:DNA-binding CsgD family transcriptional regulator
MRPRDVVWDSWRRSDLRIAGSPSAPLPLVERAAELEVLSATIARLTAGGGAVIVVEGAAGLGKTALLERGAHRAETAGCLVRRAAPGPLERQFPFGAVRALLEAPLREAPGSERARLLDGAAAPAGELLLEGATPRGNSTTLMAHGVLWLCLALAERRPLALVVDDAQWADRSSLEVLLYVARRIEDVPLLILVAARAHDPDAASDLLTLLGSARAATVLRPGPLTARGAVRLIRQIAPATPVTVCRECHSAVGGSPWLLGELARQIAAYGAEEIGAPTATVRIGVRRRLAELPPRDRRVVEAMAIVGDGAAPDVVAAVAGVAVGELHPARDGLRAAGLLTEGESRFAHGLIAAAIADGLARTERERLHREAARALMAVRADCRLVASHLLECGPQADPAISECLQEAARHAEPQVAAAYLERALAEGVPGEDRGELLARLGTLSFDAGLPGSRQRLREALREVRDRDSRIAVLTRLAALNLLDAADDGLAQAFEQELARETDPDVRLAVEVASLDALLVSGKRHGERARRVAAIDLSRMADPLLERVILAHRAWVGVERGMPDAGTWAELAQRALEHDLLLGEAHSRAAYALCARVLLTSDHPQAGPAIAAMRGAAVERGALRLRVAAEWYAADHALRTGRVAEAENLARLALELAGSDRTVFTGVVEVLVCALAERGAFGEARELLRERGLDNALGPAAWAIGVRHARARLALAERDFAQAYAEAAQLGELRSQQGRPNPSLMPWRSTAALALAHVGRRAEAARVADTELHAAERFGAPVPVANALHARAVAEPDHAERVALCERALSVVAGAPSGLEVVRLRLELGAALNSLGRRLEAREALRPALADAAAAGAVLLAEHARRALVATGLRPRRAAMEGAAALTPRQRQICELAAVGKGNRAIAQELFLSVKTVETHLAASYRKLGVRTRAELAAGLAAQDPRSTPPDAGDVASR